MLESDIVGSENFENGCNFTLEAFILGMANKQLDFGTLFLYMTRLFYFQRWKEEYI